MSYSASKAFRLPASLVLMLALSASIVVGTLAFAAPPTKAPAKAATKSDAPKKAEPIKLKYTSYATVAPLELVKAPEKYKDKPIELEATFNSFSNIGLDYKKAMRDSKDFISMLILRPDVTHHKIPLAELKLIYPRKNSEAVMDLESGDIIKIKGSVFSTALGDPWMDVEQVEVIQKAHPKQEGDKDEPECC